jgi:hypothetical protein
MLDGRFLIVDKIAKINDIIHGKFEFAEQHVSWYP